MKTTKDGSVTLNEDDVKTVVGGVDALLFILLLAPAMAWRGFVVMVLWGWFATPVFGVAAPGIGVCIGLVMLVGLMTLANRGRHEKKGESITIRLVGQCIGVLATVGVGYLIHLYV